MPTTGLSRINADMSDEAKNAVLGALLTIREHMPFLVTLSTEQRKSLARTGAKTIGFDDRCKPYMDAHPEFVPNYVKVADLEKDRALRQQLQPCLFGIKELLESVDDTMMQVKSTIYRADLSFYKTVGDAAKHDLPGAESIYEDLHSHFARETKGSTKTTPKPTPDPADSGSGDGTAGSSGG